MLEHIHSCNTYASCSDLRELHSMIQQRIRAIERDIDSERERAMRRDEGCQKDHLGQKMLNTGYV